MAQINESFTKIKIAVCLVLDIKKKYPEWLTETSLDLSSGGKGRFAVSVHKPKGAFTGGPFQDYEQVYDNVFMTNDKHIDLHLDEAIEELKRIHQGIHQPSNAVAA